MKTIIRIIMLALVVSAVAAGAEPAKPISIDTIQVLKISPQDERAVIKTPDGKMQIINVGDPIGDHAKVTEITAGRVVIEETNADDTETVIIRLTDGKQRVERIRKTGEKQPRSDAAVSVQQEKTSSQLSAISGGRR